MIIKDKIVAALNRNTAKPTTSGTVIPAKAEKVAGKPQQPAGKLNSASIEPQTTETRTGDKLIRTTKYELQDGKFVEEVDYVTIKNNYIPPVVKEDICKPTYQVVKEHYLISFYKNAVWLLDFRSGQKYWVLHHNWIQKRDVEKKDGQIIAQSNYVLPNHLSEKEMLDIVENRLSLGTIKTHYLLFVPIGAPPEPYFLKKQFEKPQLDDVTPIKKWN